jgi:hypothetical protein
VLTFRRSAPLRSAPLRATLRVATHRDREVPVEEERREVALAPHSATEVNTEELLGRFVDVSWAYRFGPPAQGVIVVSLGGRRRDAAPLTGIALPGWPTHPAGIGITARPHRGARERGRKLSDRHRVDQAAGMGRAHVGRGACARRLRGAGSCPNGSASPRGSGSGNRRAYRPHHRVEPRRSRADRRTLRLTAVSVD